MTQCRAVSGVSDCSNRAYNLVIKDGHAFPVCNFHKKQLRGEEIKEDVEKKNAKGDTK